MQNKIVLFTIVIYRLSTLIVDKIASSKTLKVRLVNL